MCRFCGWPAPLDRPHIHETIALEKKLLQQYKKEMVKKDRPCKAFLFRERYWKYNPNIGILSDNGKYDVKIGEKRNNKFNIHRTQLSRTMKKKKPMPRRERHQFIEVETKFIHWRLTQLEIARERKNNANILSFEREWVLDERNPNDKFLVAIPPATPLDSMIHTASTKLCKFWRACCARSFGKRFRASRVIQRTVRTFLAKTLAKRMIKRREDNEKRVKQMFQKRYSNTFNKWYEAAHKEKQIKRFGAILNGAFSQNWIYACFCSLKENRTLEQKAALNIIRHFQHWTFVRFRKRVFNIWHNWYTQNFNVREFIKERCFARWKKNVIMILFLRKSESEYRGAVAFQRLWRGMMGRKKYLMVVYKSESDMAVFFQMREDKATKINNRVRIYISNRRFDSRRCTKHVVSLILLKVLKKIHLIENSKIMLELKSVENLRMADEEDYITCEIRKAIENALLAKIEEHKRQSFLKKYVVFKKTPNASKKLTTSEKIKIVNDTRVKARQKFRKRWPPKMECKICYYASSIESDFGNHICLGPYLNLCNEI